MGPIGDGGELVVVETIRRVGGLVVVGPVPAREEKVGVVVDAEDVVVAEVGSVAVAYGDCRYGGWHRGGVDYGGQSGVAFGSQHADQAADFIRRISAMTAEADIVSDQVADDGGVKAPAVGLAFVEANAPHCLAEEIRRFLGVEEGDDDVMPELAGLDARRDFESESDGGGVVVGTGCVNHAVVVRAEQNRGERLISSRNERGEVGELSPTGGVGECVAGLGIRPEREASELGLDPLLRSVMPWLPYAPAVRQRETTNKEFETGGEVLHVQRTRVDRLGRSRLIRFISPEKMV